MRRPLFCLICCKNTNKDIVSERCTSSSMKFAMSEQKSHYRQIEAMSYGGWLMLKT